MKNNAIYNKLDILNNKIDLLLSQSPQDISAPCNLHEWLDEWYAVYKPLTLSKKWRDVLRGCIKRIKANTQNKPLNEYTPPELTQAIYAVPLSYTRQTVSNVLRAAFCQAARLGYIIADPMDKIDRVPHTRKRGIALTLSEQRAFLQALQNNDRKPLYLFYLLSGCRCAEALALRWSDIDFDTMRVHIRGSKSFRSDRYIPLFPQIRALLDDLPHVGETVFPYTAYAVKSHFRRLKCKYGFTFRLHDLRHTFATRCLECGINILTVSKWLGHSNVNTTIRVYAHILTDFEREEVQRFDPKINP